MSSIDAPLQQHQQLQQHSQQKQKHQQPPPPIFLPSSTQPRPSEYKQESPSDAQSVEAGPKTGNKRRRIALACSACRARKSRCDGGRPKCSTCEEMNFECVYAQSASSKNLIVGKEYLCSLENRLFSLEKEVSLLKDEKSTSPTAFSRRITQPKSIFQEESEDASEGDEEPGHGYEDGGVSDSVDDVTDGMGAIVFSNEEDSGFFGPTSNIAFTRHISRAVGALSRSVHSRGPSNSKMSLDGDMLNVAQGSSLHGRRSKSGDEKPLEGSMYDLPSNAETLNLINSYFSNTGAMFPYIHRGTFLATYESMQRTDFRQVRKTWLSLLNIILAMATNTSITVGITAEQRGEIADVYYQRAMNLCENQFKLGTSLEAVQALLLMGQYLQGSQKSTQTWTVHGLAVKASFQLGLHSSEALKKFPPLEREIRKRTWYGCIMLDRTLSMTFGRPCAIPEHYVKLELPSVPRLPPSEATFGFEHQSEDSLCFFNATTTLYRVMWKTMEQLYGGNIGFEENPNLTDIVSLTYQMENLLNDWQRGLPPNMALISLSDLSSEAIAATGGTMRYRIVLTLRYYNIRILVHRPVLVRLVDLASRNHPGDAQILMLEQMGANSIQICVSSAMDIISLVNYVGRLQGPHQMLLGAWWFSLYYTFNAALVVFASLLCQPSMSNSIQVQARRQSLEDAVAALSFLDKGNRMVEKCSNFLGQLNRILYSLTSNTLMSPHNPIIADAGTYQVPGSHMSNPPMRTPISTLPYQQNPAMDMVDLGEFILEQDLDFLNQFQGPHEAGMGMSVPHPLYTHGAPGGHPQHGQHVLGQHGTSRG